MSDVIITKEIRTVPKRKGQLCFLKGVVDGMFKSSVKLIGCVPENDRHDSDQMTIILKAVIDSGWYSAYYATAQDKFITVKKIENKPNIKS